MKKVDDTGNDTPFHLGEKEMQSRNGKYESLAKVAKRIITPFMPDQHRDFYKQLPFFVVGNVDQQSAPWVSILTGEPGFLHSDDPYSLTINAKPLSDDPLNESIVLGAPLGMLGIELGTRRRNRINARISNIDGKGFSVKVDQAFGNCPQYIQIRSVELNEEAKRSETKGYVRRFKQFDEAASSLIEDADTFFVSSFIPVTDDASKQGVDVSHRGGSPGFVKIEGNTLTIPDYPGNYFYNTMGNFLLNPKAGITFIDFDTGDLLMLTGSVELLDGTEEELASFKGAEQGWRFTLENGLKLSKAFPFKSKLQEYSMNSMLTGNWNQAKLDLAAKKNKDTWRDFKIARIEKESSVITSFYLEPHTEEGLVEFEAGQFITIAVKPKDSNKELTRTYTVSSAPGDTYYRISVKREADGLVSKYLHNNMSVGDNIKIKSPVGGFYLDPAKKRPAVLLGGGVGITPMISMARHVMKHGVITRHLRQLHVFHSSQTIEQRAFADEFKHLEITTQHAIRYYSLISQPQSTDKPGVDFNGSGHINKDVLRQTLPLDDYDFYICGPSTFMQAMYDNLMLLGVSDNRIFAESFGPAKLRRKQSEEDLPQRLAEAESTIVKFTQSDFEQVWEKGGDTLLEIAENHGLTPNFSCRNGVCGSCATKIKTGFVSYRNKPVGEHANDEVLICCAVPAEGSDKIELEI